MRARMMLTNTSSSIITSLCVDALATHTLFVGYIDGTIDVFELTTL
jgi:hypothetical protein